MSYVFPYKINNNKNLNIFDLKENVYKQYRSREQRLQNKISNKQINRTNRHHLFSIVFDAILMDT